MAQRAAGRRSVGAARRGGGAERGMQHACPGWCHAPPPLQPYLVLAGRCIVGPDLPQVPGIIFRPVDAQGAAHQLLRRQLACGWRGAGERSGGTAAQLRPRSWQSSRRSTAGAGPAAQHTACGCTLEGSRSTAAPTCIHLHKQLPLRRMLLEHLVCLPQLCTPPLRLCRLGGSDSSARRGHSRVGGRQRGGGGRCSGWRCCGGGSGSGLSLCCLRRLSSCLGARGTPPLALGLGLLQGGALAGGGLRLGLLLAFLLAGRCLQRHERHAGAPLPAAGKAGTALGVALLRCRYRCAGDSAIVSFAARCVQ